MANENTTIAGTIRTMADDLETARMNGASFGPQDKKAPGLPPAPNKPMAEMKSVMSNDKLSASNPAQTPQKPVPPASGEPNLRFSTPAPQKPMPQSVPPAPSSQKLPAKAPLSDQELDELLPLEEPARAPTQKAPLDTPQPRHTESVVRTLPDVPSKPPVRDDNDAPTASANGRGAPPPNLPLTEDEPEALSATSMPNLPSSSQKPAGESPEEILGITFDEPLEEPVKPTAKPDEPLPHPEPMEDLGIPGEEPKSQDRRSTILVAAIAVLFAVVSGAAAYYFLVARDSGPEDSTPPGNQTLQQPAPLGTPDQTDEIVLANLTQEDLIDALRTKSLKSYSPGAIVYTPIRINPTLTGGSARYVGAREFLQTMSIAIPEASLMALEDRFMPYLYAPTLEERGACVNTLSVPSCDTARFGMAFTAKPGQDNQLAGFIPQWQASAEEQFKTLILSGAGELETATFQSATYTGNGVRSIPVSYKNYPTAFAALDFSSFDNYLVVATSREALFSFLDKVALSIAL
ncbi:MAG: hypothetical protein WD850_00585 [Candidatus Spechtbacterales bacterium]